MKLTECLHRFFGYYLTGIKGVSPNTIQAYRKTFELFLPFAAKYRSRSVRTRNLRLGSLKSLAKMIRLLYPELKEYGDGILLIPQKRMQKKLIGYLHQEEILSVLSSVDLKKKDGIRDYAILNLLLDSWARAAEIAGLQLDFFDDQNKTGSSAAEKTGCLEPGSQLPPFLRHEHAWKWGINHRDQEPLGS